MSYVPVADSFEEMVQRERPIRVRTIRATDSEMLLEWFYGTGTICSASHRLGLEGEPYVVDTRTRLKRELMKRLNRGES